MKSMSTNSVVEIEPQSRVAKGEIADLIVTVEGPYKKKDVLLVLEVKKRPKTVTPYITGFRQVLKYAQSLNAWFFAVCDGWFMLVARSVINKLIGTYGVELNKNYARNLLSGLIEYHWKEKSNYLNQLPGPPNPFYLKQVLFLSLAKAAHQGKLPALIEL